VQEKTEARGGATQSTTGLHILKVDRKADTQFLFLLS
jgi:hypothetical protein